jgi:DNA-binding transcriptional LysR family regulator
LLVNDLETACEAVLAHVGIARLPSLICGDLVRRGALVTLFDECKALTPEVHAVFPSRQYLPPKVRIFVDSLAANIAPMRPLKIRK